MFGKSDRLSFEDNFGLSEGSAAHLTHEGLLPGVDLEVLLEVEPLGVDEKAADWTALVVRPEQKQYLSS